MDEATKIDGSSPRVRGTGCAICRRESRPSVHPRVCGEQVKIFDDGGDGGGSSPRVRGTERSSGQIGGN